MQHITWYRLFAVGAFAASSVSSAQAPLQQTAPANVRELATIDGDVSGFVRLPSGRALIYSVDDSTFTYDIATKRRTLLGTDMEPASVSPQGDRFAFSRSAEDRTGSFFWTMPIDPNTGTATGAAHRVSLRTTTRGLQARFSPDGKLLAFSAGPRPDGTWDIALVPATGGSEHIVASYRGGVAAFAWSADGKSLHVELNSGQTAIERVSVSGERSEPMFPRTALTGHWAIGVSPDARVAFFQNNPDRFFYRTASGVEGEIPVALPPLDDGWGHDFTLESMRYATMTQVFTKRVRVLDLATGQARDLLPGKVQTAAPAWSPDSRRLAVMIGNRSQYEIAIMNADGSGQRRYPLPKDLNGWGDPWERPWSPDGRFLAFRARDRGDVGSNDAERLLVLLDVTTGETRVLARAFNRMGAFVWRSDGKAIRALERNQGSSGTWSIVETPLNGPQRLLRDLAPDFPQARPIGFIADTEVAFALPKGQQVDRYVVQLDGGAARRLPDVAMEKGSHLGGTGVFGQRVSFGEVDARNEARVIRMISIVGDSTRTLRIPFNGHHGALSADGTQIINVGKAPGDSLWKIFMVPLDGSPPRLVGEIPGGTGGPLSPSPDGKFVAYTSEGRYTSKIHEIDFSPALQAIVKR